MIFNTQETSVIRITDAALYFSKNGGGENSCIIFLFRNSIIVIEINLLAVV